MKWLIACLITISVFSLIFACSNDDDDDNDDNDDNNDADDDDNNDDNDDTAGDDDLLGSGDDDWQVCVDDAEAVTDACVEDCPADSQEDSQVCIHYHCYFECKEAGYAAAAACVAEYPELQVLEDLWLCWSACDADAVECLEPVDECNINQMTDCMAAEQQCTAACSPISSE